MMQRTRIKSEAGVSKLTLIVFGLIIFVILFTGYRVLPFYYDYYEIQNQMEAAITVASTEKDIDIRKKLLYHIRKLELPVEPEDLQIERDGGIMRIRLVYDEIFDIQIPENPFEDDAPKKAASPLDPEGSVPTRSAFWGHDFILRTFHFDAHAAGKF